MVALDDTRAVLGRLDDAVRSAIVPTLLRAEKLITDERLQLMSIDDPAARQAASAAEQALNELRNVLYGWLPDYQRFANDLSKRLANI